MQPTWYFDFVSPFSYLQWPRIRALSASRPLVLKPILFAGLLGLHGHKGPAEIPGKREFTYRFVLWKARQQGRPLVFPPAHPFNPVAALRLCIAAGTRPEAIETIFEWIWAEGRAGDTVEALEPVARRLGIEDAEAAVSAPGVKDALRANYEEAVAAGVFGVPTLALGEDLFWGEDAHDFAMACLADPGVLADAEMQRLSALPVAVRRMP